MKYNKKIPTIPKLALGFLMLMISGLLLTGCSDKLVETALEDSSKTLVSEYDGQPILAMNDLEYYEARYFENWRNRLVGDYGSQLMAAVNAQATKAKANSEAVGSHLLLKEVLSASKAKGGSGMSTHLRLSAPDGETEEFMLSVRRYVHDAGKAKTSAKTMTAGNTWLALSPDRFYLQDDEEGKEQWPVSFPAVNMADSSQKIMITFNKDGFVSATRPGSRRKLTTAADTTNLMLIEAMPVVSPNDIDPCYPDCGGGGGGGGRTDDNSRGGPTGGPTYGTQTYFSINSLRLKETGDGDGAAELQMFVQNNDSYSTQNMPRKYQYRFDVVFRNDPVCNCPRDHTKIKGADGASAEDYYYEVPDINHSNETYNFIIQRWETQPFSDYWTSSTVTWFPLFDLTHYPGPWRLLLSDDDKDYQDFSRRRQSSYDTDMWTYDMSAGSWSVVNTGFTVERKTYGSSDDPLIESGVRRITESNVQDRMDSNGSVVASRVYAGGRFTYNFSLSSY